MLCLILYLLLEERFFIIFNLQLLGTTTLYGGYGTSLCPSKKKYKKNQQEFLLTDNKIVMIIYASSLAEANIPFLACFIAIACIAIEIIVI